MVVVRPVKRITEELSSLMMVIQLRMRPESTPDIISGAVTFQKVLSGV